MLQRIWFWIQKKKTCKCFCVTCRYYKQCKKDMEREEIQYGNGKIL